MVLLDTHIWIWWANESQDLSAKHRSAIEEATPEGLGVSVISCWEVANLVRLNRLALRQPPMRWVSEALNIEGIQLLDLTPDIAVAATQLTDFHKDPADRFLVATAQAHDIYMLTKDARILNYPHVKVIQP